MILCKERASEKSMASFSYFCNKTSGISVTGRNSESETNPSGFLKNQ